MGLDAPLQRKSAKVMYDLYTLSADFFVYSPEAPFDTPTVNLNGNLASVFKSRLRCRWKSRRAL